MDDKYCFNYFGSPSVPENTTLAAYKLDRKQPKLGRFKFFARLRVKRERG